MMSVPVIIVKEHGSNCEMESKFAFERVGAKPDIVHMQDLLADPKRLFNYKIAMFIGGFSYGDDTGSAYAWANRVRTGMFDELKSFVEGDTLTLGVCNGFQLLVNLGLVPNIGKEYVPTSALLHNDFPRYGCRWVDVQFSGNSPWTKGIEGVISLPVAHGEGKFFAHPAVLDQLRDNGVIAGRYVFGRACEYLGLTHNPNGSLENIASISDGSGRVLGMMPHPERAIDFTHLPYWPKEQIMLKREGKEIPKEGPGLQLFRNAVDYFERRI